MAGFDHGPNQTDEHDNAETTTRNSRYGLVLFAVYLLIYGGFVGLSAFRPELMEVAPIAGINLAILYGFGLIAAAFMLALVYGWLCRSPAPSATTEPEDEL
jgi:uncharacterized membrane protein (DUF485 family)